MKQNNPGDAPHILIATGGFYQDIARELEQGAVEVIERSGATYDLVELPGALEIPIAISMAYETGRYDGVVALGCVIRGETYHFEIVANESSRALMDLAINLDMPLGNGILTVENKEQAFARLEENNHKGKHAAEACLNLINYKKTLFQAGHK